MAVALCANGVTKSLSALPGSRKMVVFKEMASQSSSECLTIPVLALNLYFPNATVTVELADFVIHLEQVFLK